MKTKTQQHPAEVYTLIAGILVIAATLGFELSETFLLGALAVITTLPSVITYIVNIYRSALE